MKVGSHLAYQAHERRATGRSCRSNPAARVTQENSPSSKGVVREIALSDHLVNDNYSGRFAPITLAARGLV